MIERSPVTITLCRKLAPPLAKNVLIDFALQVKSGGAAIPNIPDLARRFRTSETLITGTVVALEQAGLIARIPAGPEGVTRYRLDIDKICDLPCV